MKKSIILFLLCTSVFAQNNQINVASLNFRVQPMTEHTISYGFAKGDRLIINYDEERGKKLKSLILSNQSGSSLLSEFNVVTLTNKEFVISNTGIYTFKFINSSLARRIINFKIDRIPRSQETVNFNTEVKQRIVTDTTYNVRTETFIKEESFEVIEVATEQDFYINSGSNAMFKGGKSRVVLPISLPNNTIKWYYQVSSFRNEKMKERVSKQMNLVSDLTNLLDKTGTVSFAFDLVSQPPGADYCDVYLIDHDNYLNFINKQEFSQYPVGTRENIKSANVEIPHTYNKPIYLGVKNPDPVHGINVIIKVAALVHNKILGTREIKEPVISSRKEYYLEDN